MDTLKLTIGWGQLRIIQERGRGERVVTILNSLTITTHQKSTKLEGHTKKVTCIFFCQRNCKDKYKVKFNISIYGYKINLIFPQIIYLDFPLNFNDIRVYGGTRFEDCFDQKTWSKKVIMYVKNALIFPIR